MKAKTGVLSLIGFFCVYAAACAQYDTNSSGNNQKVPPGKELITINGAERIVNKGAIVTKEGSTAIIEGFRANTARRLEIAENNIAALQQKVQELGAQIEQLRAQLEAERAARKKLEGTVSQSRAIPENKKQ